MLRTLSKPAALIALLIGALVLAGCGESSQEKAQAKVCAARSDITKQVKTLSELTLSTDSLTQGREAVEAIVGDVKTIKNAQTDLEPTRKELTAVAIRTFETQITSIATKLISSPSLSNAERQIKYSLKQAAANFEHALASVHCS